MHRGATRRRLVLALVVLVACIVASAALVASQGAR
jgi:hypothetical protein